MKAPSNAQATLLALIEEYNAEGREVEWDKADDGWKPSQAHLVSEIVNREADTSQFMPVARNIRRVTAEACVRHGWLSTTHQRTLNFRIGVYQRPDTIKARTFHQLDLTEDGVIALGLWRERKMNAPPEPLPSLTEREREIVRLAVRARELGYALCPCEPSRKEARRMRKDGLMERRGYWVSNSALGLIPSGLAMVEAMPERADLNGEADKGGRSRPLTESPGESPLPSNSREAEAWDE